MKALGLAVSEKKIFEKCILKTYFLTPWPTYATNWNGLNNLGPPRDHSCEDWSKSKKRFQSWCCLKIHVLLTHGRTAGRTMDDGQWAITKAHLEHIVLRWAKTYHFENFNQKCHICFIFVSVSIFYQYVGKLFFGRIKKTLIMNINTTPGVALTSEYEHMCQYND